MRMESWIFWWLLVLCLFSIWFIVVGDQSLRCAPALLLYDFCWLIRMAELRITEPGERRRRSFLLPGLRFKNIFRPNSYGDLPDASARLELLHFFQNHEDDGGWDCGAAVDAGVKKVGLFRQRSNSFDSGADAIAKRRETSRPRRGSFQDPLLTLPGKDKKVSHGMLPGELEQFRRRSSLAVVIHPASSSGSEEDLVQQHRAGHDEWLLEPPEEGGASEELEGGSNPVLRKIKRMLPFHRTR